MTRKVSGTANSEWAFISLFLVSIVISILGNPAIAGAQVETTIVLSPSFSQGGHSSKLARIQAILGTTPFTDFHDGQTVTLRTGPAGIRKLADEGIIDQVIGVAASGSSSPTDNPKRRYVRWDAELSIENPAKFSKTMPVRKDTKWFAKARSGAIRTMRNPNLPASLPHNFHIAALNRQGTIVEQVAYVDPRTVHYETFDDDNGINGGGTMQFEQIKFVFWLRPHDDIAEIRFLQGNLNSATTPRLIASVKVR